jgi:hypothetical protein
LKEKAANEPAQMKSISIRKSLRRFATIFALMCATLIFLGSGWVGTLDILDAAIVIVATFPLMIGAIVIAGWRLSVLAGGKVGVHDGVALNAVAQLIVLIVPSRISEAAKPIGLSMFFGLPLSSGFAILAIERTLDAVFLAGMGLAVVAVLSGPYSDILQSSSEILALLGGVGILGIAVLLARPVWLGRLVSWIPVAWLRRHADHILEALSRLANPASAAWAVGLTAMTWIASCLIFFAFFRVLGIGELSPGQILVVFVASTLGLIVSVAPGGSGHFRSRDRAFAGGLRSSRWLTAVAVALLLRLCLVVPVVAAAGWYLVSERV